MSFKLPDSLTIGGHDIKVRVGKLRNAHAEYDTSTYTITVDPETDPNKVEMYLFHEIVHACMHISGVEHVIDLKTEEAIAWSLQHLLFPLYQRKRK
jgi:hypothetical protein